MHQAGRAHDLSAVDLADGLVSETDAKNRTDTGEGLDDVAGHASLGRRAGTRRDHHAVGLQREGLLDRNLVVAKDTLFHAQLAEILDQVERERVIVVDDQEHAAESTR